MNIKDRFLSAVTSAVGGINDMVCMYACPSTEWNPTPPWRTIPDTVIIPEPEKKEEEKEESEKKNVDYYKKEFVRIFREMEENLGECKSVEICKGKAISVEGKGRWSSIDINIEF